MRLKPRQLYWLVGRRSQFDLYSKRLVYMYGIQLWGCAKYSNRLIIQRSQNKLLRIITGAQWHEINEELHADHLRIK